MKLFWIKKILGFVFLGFIAVAGLTYLFMLLWNMLIPDLFNGPVLNFTQALGLMVLSKILFGFGSYNSKSSCSTNQHFSHQKNRWKEKIEKKMQGMTDDEKQQFKNSMKSWCYGSGNKKEEVNQKPKNENQS